MRIAFDSNVLLDAIASRQDCETAQELILAVAEGRAEGMISANSVTDIYYIARKAIGDDAARDAIWNLMAVLDVAAVDGEVCATALTTPMKDFEDAVLAVSAAREGADFIATRDAGFIASTGSPVRAMKPVDLLTLLLEE